MSEINPLFESEESTVFVDALLPLPIPRHFTYRVPRIWAQVVQLGLRIVVPFGSSKVLTAVIVSVHQQPPKQYQAKYILEILDEAPLVTESQIKLFQWVADYYMCYPGEVFQVALPAGLKISSQSKVQAHPEFSNLQDLNEKELLVYQSVVEKGSLSYDEVARIAEVKSPYHIIKSLVGHSAVLIFDELKDRYTPKVIRKIRLCAEWTSQDKITELIKLLEDNSEALGSSYKGKMTGKFGDISIASLRSEKMIGVGEGGFISTDNFKLYDQAYLYASRNALNFATSPSNR